MDVVIIYPFGWRGWIAEGRGGGWPRRRLAAEAVWNVSLEWYVVSDPVASS